MENLAHRKQISLNDLTHPLVYSSQQAFLSYLIDGYDVPSRCTSIDSTRCQNGEPHITIDLNRIYHVHGVIIQQLDTCKEKPAILYFKLKSLIEFSSFSFISR